MIRARIVGMARLSATLRRLQAERSTAMAEAIAAGAQDVRDAAKRNLPRRSGRLARRVTVKITPDGLAATVGTELDYGTFLEFGTRRMAARPWLRPAFLGLRGRLRARLARAAAGAIGRGR